MARNLLTPLRAISFKSSKLWWPNFACALSLLAIDKATQPLIDLLDLHVMLGTFSFDMGQYPNFCIKPFGLKNLLVLLNYFESNGIPFIIKKNKRLIYSKLASTLLKTLRNMSCSPYKFYVLLFFLQVRQIILYFIFFAIESIHQEFEMGSQASLMKMFSQFSSII